MKKDGERYDKVFEQMVLLGIRDVSTPRQCKNGTVAWRLPIKNDNSGKTNIEVASFSTGYVRNQNSGYSNYQLNKRCESEPQYYKCTNKHDGSDLYRKYTTRTCKLIPIEIDRLEYLISYCLKNYFIKRANQVVEGKYVSQWYHDWSMERVNGNADLENKLRRAKDYNRAAKNKINDLENKLATIQRISDHG